MHRYARYSALVILTVWIIGVSPSFAQVMQSANYRIQSDSINVGGGYSSSTNFGQESTVGEVSTGFSSSTNYALDAGYQQGDFYLALSSVSDVTLSPSLGGVTGGTSNGSTVVTVTTDSYAGYQLSIAASTTPALSSGAATIPDYTPSGADPDYSFTNGVSESQFGFSPEGTDITARYKDNGSLCNTGSSDNTLACWDGPSTTARTISSRTSANHPSGIATTLRFRVGIGASAGQLEGTYVATTTLTALPL